jgi:hypothetical protein
MVAEAVAQWMEVAELEETTRDRYEDLIRLYIRPRFGEMKIGRLDAELLERYYAQLHRCKHLCPRRPPKGARPPAPQHEHDSEDPLHPPGELGTGRPLGLYRCQRRGDGLRADPGEDPPGSAQRGRGSCSAQRGLAGSGVGPVAVADDGDGLSSR